jgi:hypothetical protein
MTWSVGTAASCAPLAAAAAEGGSGGGGSGADVDGSSCGVACARSASASDADAAAAKARVSGARALPLKPLRLPLPARRECTGEAWNEACAHAAAPALAPPPACQALSSVAAVCGGPHGGKNASGRPQGGSGAHAASGAAAGDKAAPVCRKTRRSARICAHGGKGVPLATPSNTTPVGLCRAGSRQGVGKRRAGALRSCPLRLAPTQHTQLPPLPPRSWRR